MKKVCGRYLLLCSGGLASKVSGFTDSGNSPGLSDTCLGKIQEGVQKRKKIYSSTRKRFVLIQAILVSIPNYYSSVFKALVSVAKKIDKILRDFLLCEGADLDGRCNLIN